MHPLDRLDMVLAAKGSAGVASALRLDAVTTVGGIVEFLALRWAWQRSTGDDLLHRHLIPELPPLFRFVAGHPAVAGAFGLHPQNEFSVLSTTTDIRAVPPPGESWKAGGDFSLFMERFKDALRRAGITADSSFLLAGALKEMASNSVEHAMAEVTPLVAFRVSTDDWEFSVTDVGRGVLASMRSNAAFVHVPSAVDALRAALRDGVSCTGEAGRGCGFSTLFKALVDRHCTMRLRSAGAAARWSGRSPTDQTVTMQQLADRVGFHISVVGPTHQS